MKKFRALLAVPLVAFCMSSCVDNSFTTANGIDSALGINGSVALPIAYTTVNLIDGLSDNVGTFTIITEGEEIFLQTSQEQSLTADFFGKIEMFPQQEFTVDIPFTVEGAALNADEILNFVFEDINKENSGQVLDSLLYPEGQALNMVLTSDVSFAEGSSIQFIFDKEEIELNHDLYPDNVAVFDNVSGTLSDFMVDMKGATVKFKNGSNVLNIGIKANLIFAETTMTPSVLSCYVNFSQVEPKITYGHISENTDIFEETMTIGLPYADEAAYNLPFSDPEIDVTFTNSIGIEGIYTLEYLKAIDAQGNEVSADFNGVPGTSITVANPDYSAISDLSKSDILSMTADEIEAQSEITFDKSNGSIDRLFGNNPRMLEYKFSVKAADNNAFAYYLSDSEINIRTLVTLPLKFAGDEGNAENNFYMTIKDTVNMDMSSVAQYFTSGEDGEFRLIFTHKNRLPLDTQFTINFLDENNNRILTDVDGTFSVAAAPTNSEGEAVAESETSSNSISFYGSNCDVLLQDCKAIEFQYKVLRSDFSDVWLHTNDWLYLQISAGATGTFQF